MHVLIHFSHVVVFGLEDTILADSCCQLIPRPQRIAVCCFQAFAFFAGDFWRDHRSILRLVSSGKSTSAKTESPRKRASARRSPG